MSDKTDQADQDWREQVRVLAIVWAIVGTFAALLKLGAFMYLGGHL